MTELQDIMGRRLRICGVLVAIGLLIQLASLRWFHPTAFLVFVFIGGAFLLLGILLFLYSLVFLRVPGTKDH